MGSNMHTVFSARVGLFFFSTTTTPEQIKGQVILSWLCTKENNGEAQLFTSKDGARFTLSNTWLYKRDYGVFSGTASLVKILKTYSPLPQSRASFTHLFIKTSLFGPRATHWLGGRHRRFTARRSPATLLATIMDGWTSGLSLTGEAKI